MKIAILTPMPPQKTGISDYAHDLIEGLSSKKNMQITVITKKESIDFDDFELIIYHLGNNAEFHAYMYEVLKKYGGIIHIHDIVLHQVLVEAIEYKKNPQKYFNLLSKFYGTNVLRYTKKLLGLSIEPWKTSLVNHLPFFEAFVQHSDACIVHSDYTSRKIKDKFPSLPIYKIHQLYNLPSIIFNTTNIFKIGVLGGVEVNRKVELIIESLAKVIKIDKNIKIELIIVGAVTERCKEILKLPKKLAIDSYVKFYHHVSDDEFLTLFNSIDLLIALRDPSIGETSAVVMKALQLNKLVIVSNVGWYSELPDFVDKLSNKNLENELTQILKIYLEDINLLDNKKKLLKKYNEEVLDFDNYINEYFNIIQLQIAKTSNKFLIKRVALHIEELNLKNNKDYLKRVSTKLQSLF